MTSGPPAQCLACARWRSPLDTDLVAQTCDAYPSGIPDQIWLNRADHRKPFEGDGGLRWKSDGTAFPAWVLNGGKALALLDRTYKRDKDGRFGSVRDRVAVEPAGRKR
jgi:hypothetical protein